MIKATSMALVRKNEALLVMKILQMVERVAAGTTTGKIDGGSSPGG